MKVALKKRKERRKAETKTSDKENESVQRKWLRGAVLAEESPTAWCFLSSQRQEGRQLTNCPEPPLSPPHLARGSPRASVRNVSSHQSTDLELRIPNPRLEAGSPTFWDIE